MKKERKKTSDKNKQNKQMHEKTELKQNKNALKTTQQVNKKQKN